MEDERYYIMIGNCYVSFIGISQTPTMRADFRKASPYLTADEAEEKAKRKGLKKYKIVKRNYNKDILEKII